MNRRAIDKSILKKALPEQDWSKVVNDLPEKLWLSIDSRETLPGDIFFAIKGEFADGHDHIHEAHEKGCSLIFAEKISSSLAHLPVILVKDSLKFYSLIAHEYLKTLDLIKIAITGSNGKTTTKEMLKACLDKIYGETLVYASAGNRNNHFGIPLSALEATPAHRVAIFEMGMNNPLEIASHCSIIEPHFGIITNISFAHEGNFADGILGVARAKGELFQFLASSNGTVIVNLDDERVTELTRSLGFKKPFSFGHSENADMRILENKPYCLKTHAQEVTLSSKGEKITLAVPLLGAHHAKNAAGALAVVLALGQDVKKASEGISSMKQTHGRMNLSQNPHGFFMINDGYNANPASMKAGILASLELSAKRRIAVIGAMGELGEKSALHHHELGTLLATHFDQLFICGKAALETVKGAKDAGFPEQKMFFRETSAELIEPLKELLTSGDLVFVKGSLSANMKAITDALGHY